MSTTKGLTNALLKEKMTDAMVYRGYCSVLENATMPGYYSLDVNTTSSTQGLPSGWNISIVEVLKRESDLIQRLTRIDGDWMAIRVFRQGEWKPFKKLAFST